MSTQDIEITDGGQLQPGDVILRVYEPGPPAVPTLVRREIPDPLPGRPGYYMAEEPYGGPAVIELLNQPDGQWVDAGDRSYLTEEDVRALGPLRALIPVDEIADAFRTAPTLNGGIELATVALILARCGVTL